MPVQDSFRALRVMLRLSGLLIFIFRNDPDLHNDSHFLSVRPKKWLDHVGTTKQKFKVDALKVNIPEKELETWQDYFELLWRATPMFLLGTKKHGLFYVPEHPTFWQFLERPKWQAMDILGQPIVVEPGLDHVNCTDWTYFGLCRPRWRLKETTDLCDLRESFAGENLGKFFEANVQKIVIENRADANGFPNHELASVAFVVGMLENLDQIEKFALAKDYQFWKKVFQVAQIAPLLEAVVEKQSIKELVSELMNLAQNGLKMRGFGEEKYLEPVWEIIENSRSRAEDVLKLFNSVRGTKTEKARVLAVRFAIK